MTMLLSLFSKAFFRCVMGQSGSKHDEAEDKKREAKGTCLRGWGLVEKHLRWAFHTLWCETEALMEFLMWPKYIYIYILRLSWEASQMCFSHLEVWDRGLGVFDMTQIYTHTQIKWEKTLSFPVLSLMLPSQLSLIGISIIALSRLHCWHPLWSLSLVFCAIRCFASFVSFFCFFPVSFSCFFILFPFMWDFLSLSMCSASLSLSVFYFLFINVKIAKIDVFYFI